MLIHLTEYVLGFCFNEAMDSVVLMCKNRPKWQKGHFNGVGGKLESGESILEAMIREYKKETGVDSDLLDWTHCISMKGIGWRVEVFRAINDEMHDNVVTKTDEDIFKVGMEYLSSYNLLPNLHWMIPMLNDEKISVPIDIKYDMRQMERIANCPHEMKPTDTEGHSYECIKCGMVIGVDYAKG